MMTKTRRWEDGFEGTNRVSGKRIGFLRGSTGPFVSISGGGKILLNAGVLMLREIDERDADIPLVTSRETDGEVLDNVTIRDGDAD
jgi:hypothetical protein